MELNWAKDQLHEANILIARSEEKFESTLKNVVKITNLLTSSLLSLDKILTSKKDSCDTHSLKNLIHPGHKHGPQARHRVVPMVRGLPISTKPTILLSRVDLPSRGRNSRNDAPSTKNVHTTTSSTTRNLTNPLSTIESSTLDFLNLLSTSSASDSATARTQDIASDLPGPTENVTPVPIENIASLLPADENFTSSDMVVDPLPSRITIPGPSNADENPLLSDETKISSENSSTSSEPIATENIASSEIIATENIVLSEPIAPENISLSESIATKNIAPSDPIAIENTTGDGPTIIENVASSELLTAQNVVSYIIENIVSNESVMVENNISDEPTASGEIVTNEISPPTITDNLISKQLSPSQHLTSNEMLSTQIIASKEPLSDGMLTSDVKHIGENVGLDLATNIVADLSQNILNIISSQATDVSSAPSNITSSVTSSSENIGLPNVSPVTENGLSKSASTVPQTKSVKPWIPEPKNSPCCRKLEMIKENMNTTLKYLAEITSNLMNGKEEIKTYFANLSEDPKYQSTLNESSSEDSVEREAHKTEDNLLTNISSQSQGLKNITKSSCVLGVPTVKLTKLNIKVTAENSSRLQSGPSTSKMDQSFSFQNNIPSTSATSRTFGPIVKLTKLNIKVTAEDSEEPGSKKATSNMDKSMDLQNASVRQKFSNHILSSTVKLTKLNLKRSTENRIKAGSSFVSCEVDQIIADSPKCKKRRKKGPTANTPKSKIRRRNKDSLQRNKDQIAGCSRQAETKTKNKATAGHTEGAAKKVNNITSNCVVELRRENF